MGEQFESQYIFRQLEIKTYRAICLLQKLSTVTVEKYWKNTENTEKYKKCNLEGKITVKVLENQKR